MARTKQSAGLGPRKMLMTVDPTNINKNNNNTGLKKPRQPPKVPKEKQKKPLRFKPGMTPSAAQREIFRLRKSTELLIKRRPFERVVREISQSLEHVTTNFRYQKQALEALQEATEAYLIGLLMDADVLAKHAKRATLKVTDLLLVQKIRAKQPKKL
jgi:histone H3